MNRKIKTLVILLVAAVVVGAVGIPMAVNADLVITNIVGTSTNIYTLSAPRQTGLTVTNIVGNSTNVYVTSVGKVPIIVSPNGYTFGAVGGSISFNGLAPIAQPTASTVATGGVALADLQKAVATTISNLNALGLQR